MNTKKRFAVLMILFVIPVICVVMSALIKGSDSDKPVPTNTKVSLVKVSKPTATAMPTKRPTRRPTSTKPPTSTPPSYSYDCLDKDDLDFALEMEGMNPDWVPGGVDWDYVWHRDRADSNHPYIAQVGISVDNSNCLVFANSVVSFAYVGLGPPDEAIGMMAIPLLMSNSTYWEMYGSPFLTDQCLSGHFEELEKFMPDNTFWTMRCEVDYDSGFIMISLSISNMGLMEEE